MTESQKKFSLLTYGCQMNNADSERIVGILNNLNYSSTEITSEADLILLNTCSIREKAEQKVFSQLGRLKKVKDKKAGTIIGVCGCIAQLHGKKLLQRAPYVDLVLGTDNIDRLPLLLKQINTDKKKMVAVDENPNKDFLSYRSEDIIRENRVKAFVNIMKGCNNFCSYCIVPYTRGREKSRPTKDIIDEISALAESGYKEVTLLGQNVNSYGKDLSGEPDFPDLLMSINEIKKIERIRFVTSHPKDMSDKLIEYVGNVEKVCEHIHLPVQSGSNKILELMNRGYTAENYLEKIEKMRLSIKNLSISTDIIVGFPGENEKDFEETKNIVEKTKYDLIYLFKYSKRPETKAATLEGRVSDDILRNRFDIILDIQKNIMLKRHESMVEDIVEVLVEGKSKKDDNKFAGRTRTNKIINFYSDRDLHGSLVNVKITKGFLHSLEGEVIKA